MIKGVVKKSLQFLLILIFSATITKAAIRTVTKDSSSLNIYLFHNINLSLKFYFENSSKSSFSKLLTNL